MGLDMVGVDDGRAVSMLMDHLYELGHREMGFFGRCGDVTWSRERYGSYVTSLCRLGLAFDPYNVCDVSVEQLEKKVNGFEEQIDHVAKQIRRGVRGWMCVNDRLGYFLCKGLKERGFEIPKDVSVTGFDNSETDHLGCGELTSMSVPALKIGAEALRRLMTRLRHPVGPSLHVKLQCKFVEGETTGSVVQE